MHRLAGISLLLVAVVSAQDRPVPKWPVDKAVTAIDGPLTKEGYIDYETALNQLLSKGITPERNANVLIWQALGPTPEGGKGMPPAFYKWLGIEPLPKEGNYFVGTVLYLQQRGKNDRASRAAFTARETECREKPWQIADAPEIAAYLQANEKPLASIVEGCRRPDTYSPLVLSREPMHGSLSGLRTCQEVAGALHLRAMLRLGHGAPDDACQDLLACHRLARHLACGTTLIESMIGEAIERATCRVDQILLDRPTVNAAQIRAYQKDFQALKPTPSVADRIELQERFFCLDTVQNCRRDLVKSLEEPTPLGQREGKLEPEQQKAVELALKHVEWEPAMRTCNRWLDRLVVASRIADRTERVKKLTAFTREVEQLQTDLSNRPDPLQRLLTGRDAASKVGQQIGEIIVVQFGQGLLMHHPLADRAEQSNRNLRVAFALAIHQREKGRYPEKLADLVPDYLPAIPDDLFSGKPLIYKAEAKGVQLTSVGVNGIDEKGSTRDDEPRGDDLSVRMPVPRVVRPKP